MRAIEYFCPECNTPAINLTIKYGANSKEPSTTDIARLKEETTLGNHICNTFYCHICNKEYTAFELKVEKFEGSVEDFKKLRNI